jgi:hypothetical protein
MKEQDLIAFGFEKITAPEENFYYYLLDIMDLILISNDSDNLGSGKNWYVILLEFEDITIDTKKDLETFLKIINQDEHVSDT